MNNWILKTSILIVTAVMLAGSPVSADTGTPREDSSFSIGCAFAKLWQETGLYRFFKPKDAAELQQDQLSSALQAAETAISNDDNAAAREYIAAARKYGASEGETGRLEAKLDSAGDTGSAEKGLLPDGLGRFIMILVGLGLIYLAAAKNFEPLLLLPIGFGAILTNIPLAGIAEPGLIGQPAGFLQR